MKELLVKDLLMIPIKTISPRPLDKVKQIVIYLGNTCNFDCVYCDRGYIESIGGQNLGKSTSEEMREFIEWAESQPNELERMSFHGGEPFLFIKRMEDIMLWLYPMAKKNNWEITITTNGSLIKECESFFEKYKDVLYVTVSYDFIYQKLNREEFDVYEMANVLNTTCKNWQWQFVLPIDDPSSFSFDTIKDIVNTCYKTNCRVINIIPLRHKRGKDKFEVIIDRIDLSQFLDAFLQFLQILYIKKISVYIDGNYFHLDKAYFTEHHKLILSPDGYIYPEFDFLEFKIEHGRIGNWRNKQIWKNQGDQNRIYDSCMNCEKRPSCGLKYLYYLFEVLPGNNCKQFYTYIDYAIMHNAKLIQQKNLLHWIGIKEDFEIKI